MRLIIVSNRLPYTLSPKKEGFELLDSAGGVVSGIKAFLKQKKESDPNFSSLWVGWPGIDVEPKKQKDLSTQLRKENSIVPIFLPQSTIENFYEGFCNKIIWPLFHYFSSYVQFDDRYWDDYIKVNKLFADEIIKILKPDDVLWIHDYHLMLLPSMIRKKIPNANIGFFLHIPFPSYEIFRLLPSKWREELLNGMLGADVLGFHTYDYAQYFYRTVLRILGYPQQAINGISVQNRLVRIEAFPMGIDVGSFNKLAKSKEVANEKKQLKKTLSNYRIILSIDRLDYTKGVLNRLEGYERFLSQNKKWHKKVVFVLVSVPSRIEVEQYQIMKKQMEEVIARINGQFASIEWTPIYYQYKSLTQEQLGALYSIADVALVTPLRDGMNLVAKEYIASKVDKKGVLILSEMAGAAKELSEAIIINPNSREEISKAISKALNLPKNTQVKQITKMQNRLQDYDVFRWVEDFMGKLDEVKEEQANLKRKLVLTKDKLRKDYTFGHRRLILLDYDGTSTELVNKPHLAKPTPEILKVLKALSQDKKNEVVIISGRDSITLENWFGNLSINLVAEHGVFIKERWSKWKILNPTDNSWMLKIKPLLKLYIDQVPGSFIEEKTTSIAWHYRLSDPELALHKAKELVDDLIAFTSNTELQILHGNKVIEVKNKGLNKGSTAERFLSRDEYDFILAIGDDTTDEDLFSALPAFAYTIKVGSGPTLARFNIANPTKVLELLSSLVK